MGFLDRLLKRPGDVAMPLYDAAIAQARAPHWYLDGQVPDTLDGRFDMVAALVSMLLIRLEREPAGAQAGVRLTERFIEDMDQQVRQIGFGDMVVGKQIGRMMAMLGGRLGAYRDGLAAGDLKPALVRNLYRGVAPAPAALTHVADGLVALDRRWADRPVDRVIAGDLS